METMRQWWGRRKRARRARADARPDDGANSSGDAPREEQQGESHAGPQASFDQLLRHAAERRPPTEDDEHPSA